MKLRATSRRKAISPLIATLILIAITIVGGVVVYRAFFSTASSVSSNLHATIQDVSVSNSGGLAATVKNDGTTSFVISTFSISGLAGSCSVTSTIPSAAVAPGNSIAVIGTCQGLTVGGTYSATTTIADSNNPDNTAVATFTPITATS